MRTARHKKIVAFKTFLRTLLHELCHHLDFVGVEWDEKCLEFYKNKRYARTASYAQVTEKLYTRSVFRYKNYENNIQEIIPILEPAIKNTGI